MKIPWDKSGNGLVSSGKNQLPEPVLTKILDAIWHDSATSYVEVWSQNSAG